MRDTFARRVFRFAGIYGLVVLPSQRLGRDALWSSVSHQGAM
jgi:hypothetical protein